MTENVGIRPTGGERYLDITGYVFPWSDESPALLSLIDYGTDVFLVVYSTLEKLKSMMATLEMSYDSIKRIDNGNVFLESIPLHLPDGKKLRIMVDPWVTDQKTTRFTEIPRN